MISDRRSILSCVLEATVPPLPKPTSLSAKAGLSYERRVTRALVARGNFHPQLMFRYQLNHEDYRRMAIIDGLQWQQHVDYPALTVVEIKNQLNEAAFTQLKHYIILVAWWSRLPVNGVLICNEVREVFLKERQDDIAIGSLPLRALKRLEQKAAANRLRACVGYNLDTCAQA